MANTAYSSGVFNSLNTTGGTYGSFIEDVAKARAQARQTGGPVSLDKSATYMATQQMTLGTLKTTDQAVREGAQRSQHMNVAHVYSEGMQNYITPSKLGVDDSPRTLPIFLTTSNSEYGKNMVAELPQDRHGLSPRMPLYANSFVDKQTDRTKLLGGPQDMPTATMADTQMPSYSGPGPLKSTGAFHPTRENFKEKQSWNFAYVPEQQFWSAHQPKHGGLGAGVATCYNVSPKQLPPRKHNTTDVLPPADALGEDSSDPVLAPKNVKYPGYVGH